jgi:hypothetical protein
MPAYLGSRHLFPESSRQQQSAWPASVAEPLIALVVEAEQSALVRRMRVGGVETVFAEQVRVIPGSR